MSCTSEWVIRLLPGLTLFSSDNKVRAAEPFNHRADVWTPAATRPLVSQPQERCGRIKSLTADAFSVVFPPSASQPPLCSVQFTAVCSYSAALHSYQSQKLQKYRWKIYWALELLQFGLKKVVKNFAECTEGQTGYRIVSELRFLWVLFLTMDSASERKTCPFKLKSREKHLHLTLIFCFFTYSNGSWYFHGAITVKNLML